jgi:hypothetical protein
MGADVAQMNADGFVYLFIHRRQSAVNLRCLRLMGV